MFEDKPVAEVLTVSLRTRVLLYAATWAAALPAVDPRLWALVYLFPTGLFAFARPGQIASEWGLPLLVFSWTIYVVHAVFFFRARRREIVWVLYALLLVLFVSNVAGCHQMLRPTGYGR